MEKLRQNLETNDINHLKLDGVKIIDERGSWLLRPSNTESALILSIEGYSVDSFKAKVANLQRILSSIGLELNLKDLIDKELDFDSFLPGN
jgi:phosphomannomutase